MPLSLFLLRGERATFCLFDKVSDFSRPRHGLFIKRWRLTKQKPGVEMHMEHPFDFEAFYQVESKTMKK